MFDTVSALLRVLEKGFVYRVSGKQGTGALCFLRLGNGLFFEAQTLQQLSALGPGGSGGGSEQQAGRGAVAAGPPG